jgi:hypothetical protein
MFVNELTRRLQRGKQFTRGAVHRRDSSTLIEEHLQLEYKSALYEDNNRGRREFLLDICMFANSSGGILLTSLGVYETACSWRVEALIFSREFRRSIIQHLY